MASGSSPALDQASLTANGTLNVKTKTVCLCLNNATNSMHFQNAVAEGMCKKYLYFSYGGIDMRYLICLFILHFILHDTFNYYLAVLVLGVFDADMVFLS